MARDGYTECSVCHKLYASGTLQTDFAGYGKRHIVPQGRWHYKREEKHIKFAMQVPVCPACGGAPQHYDYKVNVHKDAMTAWQQVDSSSELAKYMPYHLRTATPTKEVQHKQARVIPTVAKHIKL